MIIEVTLENFKCFRRVRIHPKRVTVFIGPNGTGKSSVLQALLLLKQSVGADRLQHQGEFVNFADPKSVAPNFLRDPLNEALIRISFTFQEPALMHVYVSKFEDTKRDYRGNFRLDDFKVEHGDALPIKDSLIGLMLHQMRVVTAFRGLETPRSLMGDRPIGDESLAESPKIPDDRIATTLAYIRPWEEAVSRLMERVTGTRMRAEIVPSNPMSVELRAVAPSGAVNMVSEGFGTNALVLLLFQLVSADKGATVLVEEPEIHLHPRAQADLAEVMAETALKDDKQLIVTTHSQHVVGRLLTLVSEGELSPDELAIYAFEKDEKGECFASEIEVTEGGQVIGGLKSFFDTDMAEWERYLQARMPAQ